MRTVLDDLRGPEIAAFLAEHLADMRSASPPESKHALDIEGLRRPGVTSWTVWDDEAGPIGCGAIKELDDASCEIKSMRTRSVRRRQGVATHLLGHLVATARERGYRRIWLETGSTPFFEPARRLYLRHGFGFCEPFGDYEQDPNSVHMTLAL